MTSAETYEFDFKTAVFKNTLVFKSFRTMRTGPIKSKMFFGKSPFTSQTLSWYYIVNTGSNRSRLPNSDPNYLSIEAIVDPKCVTSKLNGEVRIVGWPTSTCGIITSGSRIGEAVRLDRELFFGQNMDAMDGRLTVQINLEIYEQIDDINLIPQQRPQPIQTVPDSELLDHLADLLESEKFSDVAIVVGKKEFLGHKAILTARSSYFAAMFEHDMQESNENKATLEGIDPKVFQEVLRFIYTGLVKNLDELANELLEAADKYALDKLKTLCEDQLKSTLAVETAAKTLCLADLHNAEQLKQHAVRFITQNIKAIPTTDWQTIIATNPALAAQMFAEMARLDL